LADCCCGNDNTLIFACSGGSNVGKLSDEAARALDGLGQGRMYCAIGVAAGLESFVRTAREADKRVAIDGCEVQCVRKAFDALGLTADVHVVVTALGIAKDHHFDTTRDEVAQVVGAVADAAQTGAACCTDPTGGTA
jgi:uncharacterized metal-binding protein